MSVWFPALFACLTLFPSFALGQGALPSYQPLAVRQLCEAAPVFATPGGAEVAKAAAGDVISVTDLSFDPDGVLYLGYGDGPKPVFVSSEATAHFCEYRHRADARPVAFLSPPNTCHVVAASRRTLDEVNAFAAQYGDYAEVMNVFRSQNGWYAISFGLVSNAVAAEFLANGDNIPDDAYCSDGSNYSEVMEQQDGQFYELSPAVPVDDVKRMDEATALGLAGSGGDKGQRLRRSCLLGNGTACGSYASLLTEPGDPSPMQIQDITRFNLLGCMLGEPVACNNLLFGQSVHNRTLFAAFADRTSAASAPPVLDPELAKIGCDADLAPSCWELAKPAIQYRSKDRAEYLTSVQASLRACLLARLWYCSEYVGQMSYRYTVMLSDWPPSAYYGAARAFDAICADPKNAGSDECANSFGSYMRFLESSDGTDDQRNAAALAIRNGCDAASMTACGYKSALPDYFQLLDRRFAAAKVRASCDSGQSEGNICERLDASLGTDLPEAQDSIRAEYERRAELCRTEQGTDGSNPCRDAFWYYGGYISTVDIEEPLALFRENCVNGARITGCGPLYRYYNGDEFLFANDRGRKRYPAQPDMALKALRTGCNATLEAVSNCGSLGLYYEQRGDFAEATRAYAVGCDTGMTANDKQYFGQSRVCYWAAKHARDNVQDYASARRWFGYDCRSHDNPFACKFLGLMHAQAEGGPPEPLTALGLYRLACDLVDDIASSGDGQACFFYGQSLVAQRERPFADAPASTDREPGASTGSVVAGNLTEASRAYLRGCTDDVAQSCAAHARLLQLWSGGGYPRDSFQCRVIDAANQTTPAKTCQRFSFYLPAPEGSGEDGWASVFVWPDGDRTVTYDDYAAPRLNGANADWSVTDGDWKCLRNSATERSFCFKPV